MERYEVSAVSLLGREPAAPPDVRADAGPPTASAAPQWLRVIAAGCAFSGFGLGALVLSFVVLPVAYVFGPSPAAARRRCQRIVAFAFRGFLAYLRACGLLLVQPPSRRPAAPGPAVFVANHPSLIDVTFLLAYVPDLCCVVKPGVAYNPLFFTLIRLCGHVPLGRGDSSGAGMQAYATARERLSAGHSLLVFPEGTRTPARGVLPFHRGAFEIAVRAALPVQPVLLEARPGFLKKGLPWYRIPRHLAHVRVELLPQQAQHLTQGASARGLLEATRRLFVERLGESTSTRET